MFLSFKEQIEFWSTESSGTASSGTESTSLEFARTWQLHLDWFFDFILSGLAIAIVMKISFPFCAFS